MRQIKITCLELPDKEQQSLILCVFVRSQVNVKPQDLEIFKEIVSILTNTQKKCRMVSVRSPNAVTCLPCRKQLPSVYVLRRQATLARIASQPRWYSDSRDFNIAPHALNATLLNSPQTALRAFAPISSLVLRHPTGRHAMPITSMHHNRRLSRTALHLLLHIRTVLDILPEIADVATNFLVRLERERDNRDEAERKPFPRFVSRCDTRIVEGKRIWGRTIASSLYRRSCRSSGIAL